MAFKVTRSSGINRLSEREEERSLTKNTQESKALGKFCLACNKFYSYLRPEQKLCTACDNRNNSLKK